MILYVPGPSLSLTLSRKVPFYSLWITTYNYVEGLTLNTAQLPETVNLSSTPVIFYFTIILLIRIIENYLATIYLKFEGHMDEIRERIPDPVLRLFGYK